MAGIPITNLEENTSLEDSSLFVEVETSPTAATKKITFANLWESIWTKITGKILSNSEWGSTISERGYLADAKDIKDSVDSIYTKFDPAVVSQTSAPTYASNVSGAAMSLRRYGKTVSLSFSIQINAAFSAEQTIFTIPSGYRPQGSTYFVVQIAGGNNSNVGRITTNGVFTLPNNTITKGSYLVGSVTYICA